MKLQWFSPILFLFAAAAVLRGEVPKDYAGKPFNGEPLAIPGIIQAEQYDTSPGGVNDVSFHYKGAVTKNVNRKEKDAIGVGKFGDDHVTVDGAAEAAGQLYLGWTQKGQWMKYTVTLKEPGTYNFGAKYAAGNQGGMITATFEPDFGTGQVEIPTTAGHQPQVEVYHVWATDDHLAEITLPEAGTYVLTITIEKAAGMNFDYFTFVKKP